MQAALIMLERSPADEATVYTLRHNVLVVAVVKVAVVVVVVVVVVVMVDCGW
jgi:hypothetical protein